MSSVHNTVETVNAAATAIATAESRGQPTAVQKKGWGSWFSGYWCFGSYKNHKRVGHAVIIPEAKVTGSTSPAGENLNRTNTIVLPFIAPPSSPASFLQSDPPSATQSPGGLLSLTSLAVNYSPGGTASIFTVGPYAHETQLVSPPVFSAMTTEPSTAPFTPPPEAVQMTTPSSPDVPFAQLLMSSLSRPRRNVGIGQKSSLTQYDFQPCPGSPGRNIVSPGSAVSNSGTTSPFFDKQTIQLRMEENPKLLGFEHFYTSKWFTRLGSGSMTPNGWDSRLGSGAMTPNGWGSRLGSGALTPNGWGSRLGSGTLTPIGKEQYSQDNFLTENQISNVESVANSDSSSHIEESVTGQRVSFELAGDNIPICLEEKPVVSFETVTASMQNTSAEANISNGKISDKSDFPCEYCLEALNGRSEKPIEGKGLECHCIRQSDKLECSKDFNFDSTKGDILDKPSIRTEWWTSC